MTVIIWLLTTLLVIDCLFLILLVLVQLPKKEAGAGTAFGGGATDALFGAGSGNVLTKITKYSATIFLALCLLLSLLVSRRAGLSGKGVERLLQNTAAQPKAAAPAVPTNLLEAPAPARSSLITTGAGLLMGTNTLLSPGPTSAAPPSGLLLNTNSLPAATNPAAKPPGQK